ncbi:A1 cistron-splicing factor [Kickxella alabastrina]|uniref:A1 cistron-splicing factor n=1 Tax=Kickxella alabastrina TaxID=61397 RepID=UPI0022200AE6|nr:A1 cistron-splicing factor [Kickxella alabastrina]KAI7823111.1 A1 cistron-splicing factor [Kickxella alabastrina]
MDQDTARALFAKGACLVIFDAPSGMEFGIDMDTWETGPLFKGIKMIPPGIHYVHYSAVNSDKQAGMRSGFFHNYMSGEIVARRWCAETEQLFPRDNVSEDDIVRIRANIRDLDSGLAAYPLGSADGESSYLRWQRLTGYMAPEMLTRLLPCGGEFTSATGSAYEDEEMQRAQRILHRTEPAIAASAVAADADADRFGFARIDIKHSFPVGAAAEDIRRYSLDKTWLLRTLLCEHWRSASDLLGEMQLSFLIIFVGQNFAGLEHWKHLLHLVFGSAEALEDGRLVADLFVPAVRLLAVQLRECPREFVASVLEQDNFIAVVLGRLVLNLHECGSCSGREALEPEVGRLRGLLYARFGWSLPDGQQMQEMADVEEGEYAPQVVSLD